MNELILITIGTIAFTYIGCLAIKLHNGDLD